MDDRRANALKQVDPFAATDALLSGGTPGEVLFVINLCAANMPQAIDAPSVRAWGIPGLDAYRLYQVSCREDGRTRYRVRLGFFTKESDAEAVLQSIRGKFATAFTSGLADEDLKHACGYLKKPMHEIQEIQDTQRTGRYKMPKFAPEDLPPDSDAPPARQVAIKAPPPASPTIARAASAVLSPEKSTATAAHINREEIVEIELTPPQKMTQAAKSNGANPHNVGRPATPKASVNSQPAKAATVSQPIKSSLSMKAAIKEHLAKEQAASKPAVHSSSPAAVKHAPTTQKHAPKPAPKTLNLNLAPDPQKPAPASVAKSNAPFHVGAGRSIPDSGLSLAKQADAVPKPQPAVIVKQGELPRPLVSAEALSKLRAAAMQPRNAPTVIPTLDTTQTIRTLTKSEAEDATAPKWFVVQLAISDHPANLDTMPRLDIFEAYRLYSVAVMQNNIIKHALRLGFFSERVSAEAVMGYVKTFFGEPLIEQISDAEQKRFGASFVLAQSAAAEPAKPQARVITLEEKRPTHPIATTPASTPAKSETQPAQTKSAPKSAAPAVKRAPAAAKKNVAQRKTSSKPHSQAEFDEARLLGLTDTAIRRIDPRSSSLLSRLVDKLTK